MDSKEQDFMNKIFGFFKEVTKVLPPLSSNGKSAKPFDIIQGIEKFINKLVDDVTIGVKNLPPYMTKIYEINRDAEKAFGDGRYSDSIMLRYKGAEIFYRSFYKEIFDKKIKDMDQPNLIDTIKKIEKKLNVRSGKLKELNEWRKVRNKIVHQHLKVDRKKAEDAKQFFNQLYEIFETFIKEMKNPQKKS